LPSRAESADLVLFKLLSQSSYEHMHRCRRRGQGARASPLGSYPGKSGTYPGKFENIRANLKMKTFLRDHTNPMRKKGKILLKTFFPFEEHTIHLEIFCFEHSGRFLVPSQTVLLFYGYDHLCLIWNFK